MMDMGFYGPRPLPTLAIYAQANSDQEMRDLAYLHVERYRETKRRYPDAVVQVEINVAGRREALTCDDFERRYMLEVA